MMNLRKNTNFPIASVSKALGTVDPDASAGPVPPPVFCVEHVLRHRLPVREADPSISSPPPRVLGTEGRGGVRTLPLQSDLILTHTLTVILTRKGNPTSRRMCPVTAPNYGQTSLMIPPPSAGTFTLTLTLTLKDVLSTGA